RRRHRRARSAAPRPDPPLRRCPRQRPRVFPPPARRDARVMGPGERGRHGLLQERSFRLLWIGETVSQVGNAMAVVGVPLVAVVVLHASTFSVGLLTAAGWLPWLVIGLPAGAFVDRLAVRPVMIGADLLAAVLYGSVP